MELAVWLYEPSIHLAPEWPVLVTKRPQIMRQLNKKIQSDRRTVRKTASTASHSTPHLIHNMGSSEYGIEVNPLSKHFKEFENECKYASRLRAETMRGYKEVFKLFLKVMPEVGNVTSLTSPTLNKFFERIQTRQRMVGKNLKTGVKSSTIKTQWSKLNVFFKWLKQKGYIEENPLEKVRPPRVSYDDFKRLEDNEILKIYASIALRPINPLLSRRDTMMISLLLFTGVRKGEFISLRVTDIDLIKKTITVRGETSKSRRSRTLKIHDILLLHLADYLKERRSLGLKTEYLIVSRKGDRGLSRDGLKHWVEALILKSGVKFHLHQFRHTFACKLAENDTNVFKIQKMMGHTNITMTMKYARSLQTEDMEEDIGKLSFDS